MTAVWAAPISPPSLKLVVLALADWCNDTGGSLHPSMNSIASKVGVSKSQAQRLMHTAMSAGYLTVVANGHGGAPGATPHYQLHLDRLPKVVHTGSADATGSAGATGSADAADGSHQCGRRVAPMRQTGSTHATQTINKHHRTTSEPSKARKRASTIQLPKGVRREAWDDYIAMRVANGKKTTAAAKKLLVNKLTLMVMNGQDANVALEEATVGCWSSVYPPKTEGSSVKAVFTGKNYTEGINGDGKLRG